MNKDSITTNSVPDEVLDKVTGGKYDGEFFQTADGNLIPFVPEYPDIKCPNCGRTGLSALHEPMGDHIATMYCNQMCLSAYCQDENGNLIYLGQFKG